jgi:enamine deaminase RidA (YjgF/YER057c/UK114 family)
MHQIHNPAGVAKPASSYSHGIEVRPNARWLHISGQVGVAPDGTMRQGIEAQTEQCWANIRNILAAANMGVDDLVKLTTLLTSPAYIGPARAVRDRALGAARPASTLIIVAGLANPDYLVEIEAIAARAP